MLFIIRETMKTHLASARARMPPILTPLISLFLIFIPTRWQHRESALMGRGLTESFERTSLGVRLLNARLNMRHILSHICMQQSIKLLLKRRVKWKHNLKRILIKPFIFSFFLKIVFKNNFKFWLILIKIITKWSLHSFMCFACEAWYS